MKAKFLICLLLCTPLCTGQGTWWGEFSLYAGGGMNDFFSMNESATADIFTGKGMWTSGVDLRRLFGDHFSIETGASYSHNYFSTTAAGIPGESEQGSFGVIAVPVKARLNFMKYLFADAGFVVSFQPADSRADNMSGLGATMGAGFQYIFRSDIFLRVRVYASQYALLHFIPGDYSQTLFNAGVTFGAGYRFISLGKCNCPEDRGPRRRRLF